MTFRELVSRPAVAGRDATARLPVPEDRHRHPLAQADDLERRARVYESELPRLREVAIEALRDWRAARSAIAGARSMAAELLRQHAGPRWRPLPPDHRPAIEIAAARQAEDDKQAERDIEAALGRELSPPWVQHPQDPDPRDVAADTT